MTHRQRIALHAASTLDDAARTRRLPAALVGFDGFIDSIVHMVATRRDMSPAGYDRLRTISQFAQRCAAAAGHSTNIERVLIEDRFGGNGPLFAGALAMLGCDTTYIGAVASREAAPGEPGPLPLHPSFAELGRRCRSVVPICQPGHTLCMEFDDGKLMFNDTAAVQRVTWDRVLAAVPLDDLIAWVERAGIIATVNWSLLGGVPSLWEGLARDLLPRLSAQPRWLFVDLSDPAKRTDPDIRAMLGQLHALAAAPNLHLVLGLNLSEAERLGAVVGVPIAATGEALARSAAALRSTLGLPAVVIHPREGAAGADASHAAWFDGPLERHPKLSTGAGDHFNAGCALGLALGAGLEPALAMGCATSGLYVRQAVSPTPAELVQFLRDLPPPAA